MAKPARKKTKKVSGAVGHRDVGAEIIAGLEEAIAFEAGKVKAVFKSAPISMRRENKSDMDAACKALAEKGGRIPWKQLKTELFGRPESD